MNKYIIEVKVKNADKNAKLPRGEALVISVPPSIVGLTVGLAVGGTYNSATPVDHSTVNLARLSLPWCPMK